MPASTAGRLRSQGAGRAQLAQDALDGTDGGRASPPDSSRSTVLPNRTRYTVGGRDGSPLPQPMTELDEPVLKFKGI